MKKRLLLFLGVIFLGFTTINSQVLSFQTGFEEGDPVLPLTKIGITGTDEIVDGVRVLTVQSNLGYALWQWWLGSADPAYNIKPNPYIAMRIRANKAFSLKVTVKDKNNEAITQFVNLTTEWQEVLVDFSEDAGLLSNELNEIQLETPGAGTPHVLYIDNFKFGYAANPYTGSAGSSFTELFDEDTMNLGLKPAAEYQLSQADGLLKVNANKNQRWRTFEFDLRGQYDFSLRPVVNLRARAETDVVMQVFLVDANGKGFEIYWRDQGQYKYWELSDLADNYSGPKLNAYKQFRLYGGGDFQDYSFDFSEFASIIDLQKINKILFSFNGTALTYSGNVFFDELYAGDAASRKAGIATIGDRTFVKNTPGTQRVLITDILNTASLNIMAEGTVIETIQVSAIEGGVAQLTFSIKPDMVGAEEVMVTAIGTAGHGNKTVAFNVMVSPNNAPTLDSIPNVVLKTGDTTSVRLSGISDGDASADQGLVVTAESDNLAVVSDVVVDYTSKNRYGAIHFTGEGAGEAIITVTVKDDGGDAPNDEISLTYTVSVYDVINTPPTIDTPDNSVVLNTAGQQSVILTGITDGDDGSQDLQVSAISADEEFVNNVTVEYTPNEATAILKYTPVLGSVGPVDIVVTVADLGGDATNDGDKSTEMTFQVSTKNPSLPGYEFTFDEIGTWSPEGSTSVPPVFTLTVVDSGSFEALKIDMDTKWEYGGIWIPLSSELDLSEYTYIQYDVYSVGVSTWHWNYFYDALGADASVNRNIANSAEHQYEVPPGQWTTLTFDYRDEGDINNSQGNPIAIDRVNAVLLNMHNRKPAWPFTDFTGTVYYRNIRVGNAAQNVAPKVVYSTLDPIADRGYAKGDSVQSILLTGISNGTGSIEDCRIEVVSSNKNIISKEFGSKVNEDGTATVSFEVGQTTGLSILTVRIKAEGTQDAVQQFRVNVVDPAATGIMASIEVDKNETFQTMRGFGVFQFSSRHADIYTQELGASAVRIGIIENQWEPENDNDDPNVLNMEGFNYDAFDWDYFRKLKENGVETFILTSWSPPAWMKRNLSLDHREQAIEWENTDNILEPYYYEEFAESMLAVVKAFKEEADIDILALGLQNEPFFNEPYASAILSGEQFAKLIEVVGDRFAAEGLDQVGFYMPEQVFGLGWGGYSNEGYLNALKANPKADAYSDYFAVHGYDGSGITAGFPSYSNWQNLWNAAQTGDNPKEMWMTETHIGYSGFGSSMSLAGAIHGSLYAGNISLWTNWGFEDMQLTKNVPNTSFWASKNYFNYIRPGAVRVKATSNHADILVTSFINPDNSLVTVMINKSALAIPVTLSGADISDRYEVYRTSNKENCVFEGLISLEDGLFMVPANSITTLVSTSNALKLDKPIDMKLIINSEAQELIITGISNGEASLDILELTAENSNLDLLTGLTLGSIMSDGTATLNFVPAAGNMGSAQITLSLSDGENSYVTSFLVTVYDPAVMVKDFTIAKMELYPNPASDYLSFVVPEGYHTISIRDISGRLVYKQAITRTSETISLQGIEKGVYLIEAEGGNQRIVSKFVIN